MSPQNDKNNLIPRPPIVVVMGHVDHGKTSLLDYLRRTNLVEREAGGITQSIGAYEVEVHEGEHKGRKITFIDTPGHEAFSRMRSRGAAIADIAILVVASDEGPKPQTLEAIKTLNDTETPYVVAFTKKDKPNADEERIINMLLSEGVYLEGRGGNVSWQSISVKTGEGVEDLLNLIILLGDLEELKCDLSAPARGFIIESHKDNRRGIVASFILKDGTLREGDEIGTDSASGKIKILEDFLGKRAKSLTPSAPGVIIGFDSLPKIGEEFVLGRKPANALVEELKKEDGDSQARFKVILKADTSGSLEALRHIVETMADVYDASVGDVTSSDVKTAMTTGSIILNFGAKLDKTTENLARIHKVKIFNSKVIYELIKSLESYVKGGEGPEPIGELEVLKVFGKKGEAQIIGGKVNFGVVKNGGEFRVWRGIDDIGGGKVTNLQSNKKDAEEVRSGECGLLVEANVDIQEGDLIKAI